MANNGNKTTQTIICEEVFVNVMRVMGLNVVREVLFRNSCTGKRIIDFVVSKPYLKDGICYCGMVGVELKTRKEDLVYKQTGKSFKSFPFNYLLVTNDILDDAIKTVGRNGDLSHVGIIVFDNTSELVLYKQAEYCEINSEYYGELKSDIEKFQYEEYCDSIACAFAEIGKAEYGIVHNFKKNVSFKAKYDRYIKRTLVDYEVSPVTGTVAKMKNDIYHQMRMACV